MAGRKLALGAVMSIALLVNAQVGYSQEKAASTGVAVHLVVTDEAVRDNGETPTLKAANVQVKQGKTALQVNQLIAARGENAALQLFIAIDDTCDQGVIPNLNDIRDFVNAQPATTLVAIGYMSNATIQIVQNFTADHALAAKSIRLPRGTLSAMDSPYLSLLSLVKSWPQQKVRREVLMITDGVDRLRNQVPSAGYRGGGFGGAQGLPTISVDADSASQASQRYGVIVHSIFATGVGRLGRNPWQAQVGQSGIAKITEETGGEYYSLGTQNLVSFKPYLDRLQKLLDNQYYLVFDAMPKKKAGLQRVKVSTTEPDVELAAPDNAWVPASE